MQFTGVVRRVDDLGRIVIPKEIRDRMGIVRGTPIEFWFDENGLVLRNYHLACVFCGTTEDVVELRDSSWPHNELGRGICKSCAGKALEQIGEAERG